VNKRTSKSRTDGNYDAMYIGMDLHKNYLQIATMDNNGKLLKNSRIENDQKQIVSFSRNIKPDGAKVVMESSSV